MTNTKSLGTRPRTGVIIPIRIVTDGYVANGKIQHDKVIAIDVLLGNLLHKNTKEVIAYCRDKKWSVGAAKKFDNKGIVDGTPDVMSVEKSEEGGEW